jgi:uncharacterized protein (DUF1800 family)
MPQAERLLWRAGFGPRPGAAEKLASLGLDAAVESLVSPGPEKLTGPAPVRLSPGDAWGHDVLWWLDRLVRTRRPLVERMTLVWHDWFATTDEEVGSPRLLLRQNALFRRHALGSFPKLLVEVTRDPAMLVMLSGVANRVGSPNENYARELQELFTLGEGRGYTERDVREMARALTGFTVDWKEGRGYVRFRFEPRNHDRGVKVIHGRRGRFGWRDACRLCVEHPAHPRFLVDRLWRAFLPSGPPARDLAALARIYRRGDHEIRPVLRAILRHPALYLGPRMVKPPLVYVAGLLRVTGQGVVTEDWSWILELAGQRPFRPPSVAGWDEERWLDTATWRGRWVAANRALGPLTLDPDAKEGPSIRDESPEEAVDAAVRVLGSPTLAPATRAGLVAYARRCADLADAQWKAVPYRALRQNALRMLVATSPDVQTS